MLAQQAQSAVEALAVAFSALLVAAGPIALFCTKATDFVRNTFDKATTAPKQTWNVVPVVIGVAFCLGFQLDSVSAFVHQIPALAATTRLDGVAGQVATGLLAGAMASFWHEHLSATSARSP